MFLRFPVARYACCGLSGATRFRPDNAVRVLQSCVGHNQPVVPAAKFTGQQTLDGAVTRSLVLGRIIGIDVLRITRDRRTRSLIG